MASTDKQVDRELPTLIRLYKDGTVERLYGSPYVPPSPEGDPQTGIASKDVTISDDPKISARLYLPKLAQPDQKLPILVYFHGGAFCLESAFSFIDHRYLTAIVSQAQVLALSVEYRLAPEHYLPAAYDDCWDALKWVSSHSLTNGPHKDPWILDHGDFNRVFIGGDSAGGNMVHNVAMRAGSESLAGGVKLLGAFMGHPGFWGSDAVKTEHTKTHDPVTQSLEFGWFWEFVYPSAPGGIDNPLINPMGPGAPSLAGLGCSRLFVLVSDKDVLRNKGVEYYKAVKESGWKGEAELYDVEGEEHCFQILNTESDNAKEVIRRLASFLAKI